MTAILRRFLTAVGAGLTTFLLVAVLVIKLLAFEFSAIIGLPVGLLAGFAVFVGLWTNLDRLRLGVRRAVSAYAMFGLTLFVLTGFQYVNIGREVLSVEVTAGIGLVAAVVVYILFWVADSEQSPD